MPFLRCLKNDDFLLTFEVCACCMKHGFSSPDLPGFLLSIDFSRSQCAGAGNRENPDAITLRGHIDDVASGVTCHFEISMFLKFP